MERYFIFITFLFEELENKFDEFARTLEVYLNRAEQETLSTELENWKN